MKSIEPKTLKGFRDFLPKEAKKRQYVIETLKKVFESYGFEPLETPALEYEEILLGKYGEEGDKLMYRFEDLGKRRVALRYDQTVPLARAVAQYGNELPMPFKRYQIQPVWRAENTQKGRFREFLQCDADIVGTNSLLADAEVIMIVVKTLETLGFKKYSIQINDRQRIPQEKFKENIYIQSENKAKAILENYDQESKTFKTPFDIPAEKIGPLWRILDKSKKISEEKLMQELNSLLGEKAESTLKQIDNQPLTKNMENLFSYLDVLGLTKVYNNNPRMARGLDYYTGIIFEVEIEGYSAGSVCGGGRYDNLIGMFAGKQIPAVGFAFGFDRLIEAMEELNLFPKNISESPTKVLATIFKQEYLQNSLELVSFLRDNGINAEIYLEETAPLDKQLKYANQKGIPFVVILGPDEIEKGTITLRNMKTREQKTVTKEEIIKEIK